MSVLYTPTCLSAQKEYKPCLVKAFSGQVLQHQCLTQKCNPISIEIVTKESLKSHFLPLLPPHSFVYFSAENKNTIYTHKGID